ncbi:macro domain-containing protein [Kribbella jiaozuonensis]|uniref:Phage tail protein n=1 Tax=Kribbella jiaozuonensis TaxID=2575441 RepID=A0A4U3M2X7_9ACTN|nr:hypothetical protein [Kribbella jiaozuonensis]TKK83021.1 hypothetical protein FDA38_09875 [Kribbella jiaozuonensis]
MSPRLLLVDLDADLVSAWCEVFAEEIRTGAVEVRQGSLLDVLPQVDAVLRPEIQRSVWAAIADEYRGYQSVGSASMVPTGDEPCCWLVYAPTMRVPMPLTGGLDIAVHDAFWAALLAVGNHPTITKIASPGFGTGYGRVSAGRAAQLMAAAYTMWQLPATTRISQREQLLQHP